MRKIIPIMIVAIMLTICFAAVDTDSDADAGIGLWINGQEITGDVPMGDDHWSYDMATNTVTLDGATLDHYRSSGGICAAIFDYRDSGILKIVLNGENVINAMDEGATERYGVFSQGSVEFSGDGSLEVKNIYYDSGCYFACIVIGKDLLMNGGSISMYTWNEDGLRIGGNITMNGGYLYFYDNCTIAMDGLEFNMNGGVIVGSGDKIYCNSALFTWTGGMILYPKTEDDEMILVPNEAVIDSEKLINAYYVPNEDPSDPWSCAEIRVKEGGKMAAIGDEVPLPKIVYFSPNGGECNTGMMKVGDDGKLSSLPNAVRKGYTFSGWYTEQTGGEKVDLSKEYDQFTVLYAHWYNVPFPPLPFITSNPETASVQIAVGAVTAFVIILSIAVIAHRRH